MSSTSRQVRFLLKTLIKHFEPNDCSCAHVGMLLYGMRSMRNDCNEVNAMLKLATHLIISSPEPMSAQGISSAFFGLQSMTESHALRQLCVALGSQLEGLAVPLTGQEIGMCLHGLRGVGSESSGIRHLLEVLAAKVREVDDMQWSEVCMAINGLRSMGGGKSLFSIETETSSDVPYDLSRALYSCGGGRKKSLLPSSLNNLLLALADKAEMAVKQPKAIFSASSVASAVYGMRGLSADASSVRRLLSALTAALRASYAYDSLDGQNIGNLLFGLQNMTARSVQVRRLLGTVAEGISQSNCSINAQVVGNSLYGMQGLSSDVAEVRKVLRALSAKIRLMRIGDESCPENIFTGQNIGNSLWGLRNMSSDHQEVRDTLAALLPHVRASNAMMSGQNIGNALYSFNKMTDSYDEVRDMLRVLAFKLLHSTQSLSGLDVGMALFGLQNMDTSTPEVQAILGILLHKIRSSSMVLQLSDLSLAIVGILRSSTWIKDDFMRVLATRTAGMNITVVGEPVFNDDCADM